MLQTEQADEVDKSLFSETVSLPLLHDETGSQRTQAGLFLFFYDLFFSYTPALQN